MAVDATAPHDEVVTSGLIQMEGGTRIPAFALSASDPLTVPTMECYFELVKAAGMPPGELAVLQNEIDLVREWQQGHPESVKSPA